MNRVLFVSVVMSGVLSAGWALSAETHPVKDRIDQVWFGSFTNTALDGKVSHDDTVLFLRRDGALMSGEIGPAIDRLSPIIAVTSEGHKVSFRIEGGGGIAFNLHLSRGHLLGTAKGSRVNAVLDLTPAPGLMTQTQLVAEITAADAENFAAYEACDAHAYEGSLDEGLEFYQDNQPVKNRKGILDSLKNRCGEGIKLRRELDKETLIINAAPPTDAIEAGVQRIYAQQPNGGESLAATVRFTMVWSKKSGVWRLIRVVSYDHR